MVEQVLMKDYYNSSWLRSWVACRRWRPFVRRRSLGVVVRRMSEEEGEARSRGGTGTRKGPTLECFRVRKGEEVVDRK